MGTMDYETGKKWMNKNLFWAAFYIVLLLAYCWFSNAMALAYEY